MCFFVFVFMHKTADEVRISDLSSDVYSSDLSWHALREWKTFLATLLLGLASVGAIGFSPTVYASGDRIHFVCQAALLLVALRLVAALEHEFGTRTAKVSIAIVAVVAAYRVLRRSEESRVGKECVSTCSSRWSS